MNQHEIEHKAAKAVGTSRTSMVRARYIRKMAECESCPDEIRKLAQEQIALLDARETELTPAYERVRSAVRREQLGWIHTCEVCDTEFSAVRPDAVFCSNACRQMAYRRRRQS